VPTPPRPPYRAARSTGAPPGQRRARTQPGRAVPGARRGAGGGRGTGRGARPAPGGRGPRWGVRIATGLSVLVLGTGGIGHAVLTGVNSGITRVDPFKDMKNRPDAGHGMNVLVVGTDERETITKAQKRAYHLGGAPCHCTDTIMLVHLSDNEKRASVVSLPRDSYTVLPAYEDRATHQRYPAHPAKLNAAYAEGGPALTVGTVEQMTGVKINHYLEVDFTSFMKTVDALGGVDICTPRKLKDAYTGLDLAPGTHRLNGGQALQYVRSRHIDGDGSADLGRMQRQQRFVAAMIARARSSGVLLNPLKLKEVVSAALSSVRADPGFGPQQLLSLGEAMRGFSPSSSEFTSVPLSGHGVMIKGAGSAITWDTAKAKRLFGALRADTPLSPPHRAAPSQGPSAALVDVAPRQIKVQVYNGTSKDGLGTQVDAALRATGFDTTRAPLTEPSLKAAGTVVEYDPRWDRSAKSLAAALPGSTLRAVPRQGATLRVIVGKDFAHVAPVRAEPAPSGTFDTLTGDEVTCP
jgi:LCP family protein required for cell wall assembly